jgi:hypothetical protein
MSNKMAGLVQEMWLISDVEGDLVDVENWELGKAELREKGAPILQTLLVSLRIGVSSSRRELPSGTSIRP